MARTDDMPSNSPLTGRVTLDQQANRFIKDPNIPESYVVVEKSAQDKASYVPTPIGTAHLTLTSYYLYEESVSDIGNGIFEIDSKYAIVPPTWYSFESQSIPFTKFAGTTITGGGSITIVQSFLFGWLNLQGIEDVRGFNESVYASSEQKQGSINCVVRVKNEYASTPIDSIKDGSLSPFNIQTAGYEANDANGAQGNIDGTLTFNFSNDIPSNPIKFEAGKYIGNIYYNKTYEIVSQFVI
jgi:hypothetical protein